MSLKNEVVRKLEISLRCDHITIDPSMSDFHAHRRLLQIPMLSTSSSSLDPNKTWPTLIHPQEQYLFHPSIAWRYTRACVHDGKNGPITLTQSMRETKPEKWDNFRPELLLSDVGNIDYFSKHLRRPIMSILLFFFGLSVAATVVVPYSPAFVHFCRYRIVMYIKNTSRPTHAHLYYTQIL